MDRRAVSVIDRMIQIPGSTGENPWHQHHIIGRMQADLPKSWRSAISLMASCVDRISGRQGAAQINDA